MSENELTPEQVFVEYMRLTRPWAKVARMGYVYGEFLIVCGEDFVNRVFLGHSEYLPDNWADLLGVTADNWQTWQMEL
jgi:hypothetical protein